MQKYRLNTTNLFTNKPTFIKINKKELASLIDKEDNQSV
jgi:fructose-1-phosphate kinase PfkB-like protein